MPTIKIKQLTQWSEAHEAAIYTVGKKAKDEPSDDWIYKATVSEHSPLEVVQFMITVEDLPVTIYNQLVRHTAYHPRIFCQSNRPDITGKPRPKMIDDYTVNFKWFINAKAFKKMCKERLCLGAEEQTRDFVCKIMLEFMRDNRAYYDGIQDCLCQGKYGKCTEVFRDCGLRK